MNKNNIYFFKKYIIKLTFTDKVFIPFDQMLYFDQHI